ncbi:MAG TPA: Gfo/Idh/MocA family oxidoreductase [Limnochordia bacterium]|nr:Gfo/Idh/MocA family oxidoreductase [Limnochordia bacterium]
MPKRYRVGAIGFAHMHINTLLDRFADRPEVDWVACADTVPDVKPLSAVRDTRAANLKRALEHTKIPKSYDDYREMLEKERFDIMIMCPENAKHAEVVEAVAAKGIHMVVEKPMANTLGNALRMARAARLNDVKLMINWPFTWSSSIRKAKELLDQGVIGKVWEVRWRNGGNGGSMGPLAYGQVITDAEKGSEWWHQSNPGGGALLDYCCYGSVAASWYFGEPAQAAYGLKANFFSHYGDAEDHAVITVRFPQALAVIEGTWSTPHVGVPTGPIIYGSEGTMVLDYPGNTQVAVFRSQKKEQTHEALLANVNAKGLPRGFEPTEVYEGDPLPAGRTNLAEEFLHHLETGEPLHPLQDVPLNLRAMAILDAGARSAKSGKLELVNDDTWSIGY